MSDQQVDPTANEPGVPGRLGHPAGRTTGTDERASHQVTGQQRPFDLTQEAEQLRREEPWRTGDRNAKTLIKQPDLRLVLMTLKRGAVVNTHKADGRVTVHALSGRIRLRLPERTLELPAGHLAEIEPSVSHDVEAVEESAVLLTVAWTGR